MQCLSRYTQQQLQQHNQRLFVFDLSFVFSFLCTGWGKVKHPGGSYSKLQQAKLPLVSEQECKEKLAASPAGQLLNVTQQMVCAGDIQGQERGGCHGDSGGPFVCLDESAGGRFVLQGAVSWGSANCNFEQQNKQYSVFVRISEFRGWIDDNMRNN